MKTITWIWIFLLIIAVILFITAIAIYETKYSPNPMPSWNWFIIGVAFLIFIISLLLYLYSVSCRYYPENCKPEATSFTPCEIQKETPVVQAQMVQVPNTIQTPVQPLVPSAPVITEVKQPYVQEEAPLVQSTRNVRFNPVTTEYRPVNINKTCTNCSLQPDES